VVAVTVSGGWLQSSPVIPALGFPLSNRAQMFWLEEDLPASLAPRKRPRTTLSPTLARHADGAMMAFGSRGADFQDQWAAQFLFRYVGQHLGLQGSIDSPVFHSEHWRKSEYPRNASPLKLACQDTFSPDTLAGLRRRGHDVKVEERPWGRMIAARRDGDLLTAAATAALPECAAVGR
jgi:gamma-glutamyltranspeptidase / glutathione hydrolase